jgi:uncharacterized protein YndB with AHSA1/START domain/ketosteroid isomerase-like protein
MPENDALTIATAYHDAWTRKSFDEATALLADGLEVEVPINDYPTAEAFAQALRGFGSMTRGVELLSAMGAEDEAMLLYDMEVDGLGAMRVAEHFTVRDGSIERIRQIHDTAALRAAGFAGPAEHDVSGRAMPTTDSFTADVRYAASPAAVYDALATPGGTGGWWSTDGDGDAAAIAGGRIRLNWSDDDHVVFRVDSAERPAALRWTCVAQHDRNLPRPDEWVGTSVIFSLTADSEGTLLQFEHQGLTAKLDCFGLCRDGWDFFLRRSVRQLVELGQGLPYEARTGQVRRLQHP